MPLRDFTWTLIRTDFRVRYHGTFGGFIWALLKPVAMFSVLFRVFSFIFHDAAYTQNLLIGLLLWTFFAEGTSVGTEALLHKAFLVTKARFPRWVVVVTAIANATLTLLVYSVTLALVAATRGRLPAVNLLLFAWYLVQYYFIVLGISLGMSVLFLLYRDLNQIWDVVLQCGFFIAPIIYPISVIPERYHFALYLWPVTPIIQFSRAVLVAGSVPTLRAHLLLFGVAVAIFGGGSLLFRRLAARAIEKL